MNRGRNTLIYDYLIALINLNKLLTEYSSYRNNEDVKKYIVSIQGYWTSDTCHLKRGDYFFDKYEIDDMVWSNKVKKLNITEHKYFQSLQQTEQLLKWLKDIWKLK